MLTADITAKVHMAKMDYDNNLALLVRRQSEIFDALYLRFPPSNTKQPNISHSIRTWHPYFASH